MIIVHRCKDGYIVEMDEEILMKCLEMWADADMDDDDTDKE